MNESLFEIFKSELSDLGDANCDWWSEILAQNEEAKEKSVCGSPVFKTPMLSSRTKRETNSPCRTSQKRLKSEVVENEPASEAVIHSQLDWTSPISSKLTTGVSNNQGSGKMPSSLQPLLDDRSNVSWSSAFATPLASNVTWSNLNSEERKVLMPSNSATTPTVFSPEIDQELVDHYQLLDCTFDIAGISSQDPSLLEKFIETNAAKDESQCIAVLDKDESNLQSLKGQSENKSTSHILQVSNICSCPSKSEISGDFTESKTCDSGVVDGACSKRTNKIADQDLNGTSTAVIRNVLNFTHFSKTDFKFQTSASDSGAAGFSHTKLSSDTAYRNVQENNTTCSKVNPANTPNSQEFLHDLSINTLNELCQATEMMPAALCSPDVHLNRHSLHSTKKVAVRRTSTPIVQSQNTKWQRRLQFVSTEHEEDWAEEGDSIMEQAAQELRFPEKDRTIPDAASRVQEIKKNASLLKKFVYSVNDHKLQEKNNNCEVQIEDLVKSAEILELAFIADSNKKHRSLVNVKTTANETQGFLSFSKFSSSFDTADTNTAELEEKNYTPDRSYKNINSNCSCTSAICSDTVAKKNQGDPEAVDIMHVINTHSKDLIVKQTTASNKRKRESETTSVDNLEGKIYFLAPKPKQNHLCAPNINSSNNTVSAYAEQKIACSKEMVGNLNSASWNNEHFNSESLNVPSSNSAFMSDLQMIEAVEHAEIMHTLKVCAPDNNYLLNSPPLSSNEMSVIQNKAQIHHRSAEINVTSDSLGEIVKDSNVANDNSQIDASALNSTVVQQLFDDSPEDFKAYTAKNNYVNPNVTSNSLDHNLAAAYQLNTSILCEELYETREFHDKIEPEIVSAVADRLENAVSDTREDFTKYEKNVANVEYNSASDLQQISEGRASPILQCSSGITKRIRNKNSLTKDFHVISPKQTYFKKPKFSLFKQNKVNVKEPLDDFEENQSKANVTNKTGLCANSERQVIKAANISFNKDLRKQQESGATYSKKPHDALTKSVGVGDEPATRKIGAFTYKSSTKFDLHNSRDRSNIESHTLPSNNLRSLTEYNFEVDEKPVYQKCEIPMQVLPSFQGFAMASGKKVKISDEALQKAKKLFAEVNKEDSNEYCELEYDDTALLKNPHFQSNVCNETLNKTGKLFSKVNKQDTVECFEPKQAETGSMKVANFQAFATTSDKEVMVPGESLQEERKCFAEEHDERCEFEISETTLRGVHFQGFATASGKKVNITREAMQKARKLFVEVHEQNLKENYELQSNETHITKIPHYQGFATVSGKKGKVSDNSMPKARRLFAEVDDKEEDNAGESYERKLNKTSIEIPQFQSESENIPNVSSEVFLKTRKLISVTVEEDNSGELHPNETSSKRMTHIQRYATASGRRVNVSGNALQQARKHSDEVDKEVNNDNSESRESSSTDIYEPELNDTPSKVPHFQGVATVSEEEANVSSEALLKAKKLYVEVNAENASESIKLDPNEIPSKTVVQFQGFATAKEKKVDVSSEALHQARKLFVEVDEEEASENIRLEPRGTPSTKAVQFQGFATASGKKVSVSSDALLKAKKLFAEEDDSDHCELEVTETPPTKVPHFQGFATASGKKVSVSSDALLKAKKLFAEEDDSDHCELEVTETPPTKVPHFQGFATASGKKVSVSSDALLKAKKLFTEEDGSEHCELEVTETPTAKVPHFQGFATACGKKVTVSNEALWKAKKFFAEEDDSEHWELEVTETPSTKLPQFQSFATASGKKVNVSSDTLLKAKKLFAEADGSEHCNLEMTETPSTKVPQFQGFAKASGKKVSVSSDALLKAKKLFAEADDSEHWELEVTETPSTKVPHFQGFATASGKKVNVSSDALLKAKKLFAEADGSEHCKLEMTETPSTKVPQFQGFATASGKKVNVSSDALLKAKKLFAEEDDSAHCNLEVTETLPTKVPQFQGFATASGKKVNVSSDALLKAKKLFAEENGSEHCKLEVTETPPTKVPQFQGFATASGKKVNVSSDALLKAKKLFAEEDDSAHCNLEVTETPPTKVPQFQGFATASGKKVNVSSDALLKAKKLFVEEDDIEHCNLEVTETPPTKVPQFQGFATASGKKVNVSSDALLKAKKLFVEEDDIEHCNLEVTETPPTKVPQFQGFATASGKKVNVSSDALLKAKKLFVEEDDIEHCKLEVTETLPTKVPQFQGFATASGKKVSVSSDALLKAKKLFVEEDDSELCKLEVTETPTTKVPHFQGFATASGKKVSISNEALHKAKKLFVEVDEVDASESTECKSNKSPSIKVSHLQGFAPASVKKANLSNEELFKSNNLFVEECSSKSYQFDSKKNSVTKIHVQGFSPANAKTYKTSEESLCSAKTEFHHEEADKSYELEPSKAISKSLCSNINEYFEAADNISAECPKFSEDAPAQNIEDNRIYAPKGTTEKEFKSLTMNVCTCILEGKMCGDCSRKFSASDISNESVCEGRAVKIVTDFNSRPLTGVQKHVNSVCENKCKFVNKTTKSVQTKTVDCDWTLSQEVKESAAALLADDNWWNEGCISCPDMVNDRDIAPTAIISENNSASAPVPQPSSPILGGVKAQRKRNVGSSQNCESLAPAVSKFKVPYKNYKTSGPAHSVSGKFSKRTRMNLDFGTPFAKRIRTIENSEDRKCDGEQSEEDIYRDVCAGRLAAAEEQECLIKKRLKLGASGSRPFTGSLYTRKREQQLLRWRDVANGRPPEKYTISELLKLGVKADVLNVTAENALEYRFRASDHYSESLCLHNIKGIDVGDGAQLVLNVDGTAGLKEIKRAFLASPAIEPSLVPTGWVSNHYRWLIWKLAATERRFPLHFAGRCLTPNMLMLQLKYRYDREIDYSHRPALRKILEHDDSPAKRLVLCVSRIIKLEVKEGEPIYELELTDGWYGIMSCIDRDMCKFVNKGIICVGTKLITHGAELVNCEQACSPLEVGPNVRLRLYSNSTRRARWDTKLGFHTQPGPLSISLTSILSTGGPVGSVKVIVARTYPLIYIEKMDEGKSVVRSSKLEERVAAEWERKRQECAEALFSQVRAEFQQYNRQSSGLCCIRDISKLSSGDELCRLIESCSDPGAFERMLSEEQKQSITDYQMERQQQMQQELEDRLLQKLGDSSSASRTVIPVLKVRCIHPQLHNSQSAMLSIWRPSEEVMHMLKEGAAVNLFNLTATGQRSGLLQLSAGRHTRYQPLTSNMQMFPERVVVPLDRAAAADFQPPFGEVDIVGVVVHIGAAPQCNTGFQIVYMSDADMNILGVAFWGGVKQYGWEDLLVQSAMVAGCNLNKRHGAAVRWVPCVYASEYSTFSSHPRMAHLLRAFTSLQQSLSQQDIKKFYSACEEKVVSLLQGAVPASSKNRLPEVHLSNSSPSVCSAEVLQKTPESSAVQRRIHKLEQYGEPPPLSPLIALKIPSSLRKEFHVPTRTTSSPKMDVVDDSPPLSLDSDPG